MSDSASDVISDALATVGTTADGILDALDNAGFRVIRPQTGPAWTPLTPRSLAKVQRAADMINSGATLKQVADAMQTSLRQAERYSAAARELGLIEQRR